MNKKQTSDTRTVLVTGGGRGIGRAICLELANRGFRIAINHRKNDAPARETLKLIEDQGGQAYLIEFDITNRDSVRSALETDMETNGVYWGVVLNAGVTSDGPFPALSEDAWDRVLDTNLNGFYNVLQPLVMPMVRKRRGGRIVTLSSVAGIAGNRGQVNYSASKGGIIAATKALSRELAKRQITVNSVAPGLIETDMTEDLPKQDILKAIPMRRFGKVTEVSGLVGFLFSDAAGYITGEVISINGGLI